MRLFVAIAFPERVKDGLEAGMRALRKQGGASQLVSAGESSLDAGISRRAGQS